MKIITALLKNGQTVLGRIEAPDHTNPSAWKEYPLHGPYELFVSPSNSSGAAQVTLVKFGSLYGVLDGLDLLSLDGNVLGVALAPPSMQEQYLKMIKEE